MVTVKHMLDLFAVAGRVNYAKSAKLYLQSNDTLPEQHPWLQKCFQEKGYDTGKEKDTRLTSGRIFS